MILDIHDPFAAFCLDSAVGEFGRALEYEINRVAMDAKNQKKADMMADRTMRRWLDMPARFRDPAKGGVTIEHPKEIED